MDDSTVEIDVRPTKNGKYTVTIFAEEGKPLVHDIVILDDAAKRRSFIDGVVAKMPGFEVESLENELLEQVCVFDGKGTENENKSPDDLLLSMPETIRREAKDILMNEHLTERACRDASMLGIVGEELTVATLYLTGTSRLLARPMAVILQGSSSSGKSYAIENVARLFPAEAKLMAHQMTPQALAHMPAGSLEHRFVVAGERCRMENDISAESTRALREMLSSGVLRKLMPDKGQSGIIETRHIEQKGPIAYVESTTLGEIFEEDLNRCILIHTDESSKQTSLILLASANQIRESSESTILRHHAIQRMLKPIDIHIPYARKLAGLVPAEKVEMRRLFRMLLSVIEASALLNQFQRQIGEDGRIIANEDDYATAYQIMWRPIAEQIANSVSDVAVEVWKYLQSNFGSEAFTVQEILNREDCPKGRDRTYALVKELRNAKSLTLVGSDKPAKYKIGSATGESGSCIPAPQEFFQNLEQKTGIASEFDVTPIHQEVYKSGA